MKGKYDNEMNLEIPSKSCNEAFARVTVATFASQLDPTIEEIADIKTAVSEAVTNSIIHGYENSEGIIKINCKIEGRKCRYCKRTALHNKSGTRKVWNGLYNNGKLYGRITY